MATKKKVTKKKTTVSKALEPFTVSTVPFSVPPIQTIVMQAPEYNDSGVAYEGYAKVATGIDQFKLLRQEPFNLTWVYNNSGGVSGYFDINIPDSDKKNFFITRVKMSGTAGVCIFVNNTVGGGYLFMVSSSVPYLYEKVLDIPYKMLQPQPVFLTDEFIQIELHGFSEEKP